MDITAVNERLDRGLIRFAEAEHADVMEAFFGEGEGLEEDDELEADAADAADAVAEGDKGKNGKPGKFPKKGDDDDDDDDEEERDEDVAAAPADPQAEDYTGHGGTAPPDHSPMGDPEEGGSGGVDNYSHEIEALLSYVAELVDDCAGTMQLDHDAVMNGLETLAAEMADVGEIPPMPDIENASSEAISAWPLAAKMAGMAGRLAEYMKAQSA